MEWVIVTYPRIRDVFIEGRRSGTTNRMLRVRTGTQQIHLGVPVDYEPTRRKVVVVDTSAGQPLLIPFTPL